MFGQFLSDAADEHMIAVPVSGGFSLLGQKKEAYKALTKEQQRFWKTILIVDDDGDLTLTFKDRRKQQH